MAIPKPDVRETGQSTGRQMVWARPLVPDDHGAYAMLLLPMFVGFVAGAVREGTSATAPFTALALFAVSLLCLFLATEPASVVLRGRVWLGVYLIMAVLCGAPLLFVLGRTGLIWFAIVAAVLLLFFLVAIRLRRQRSMGVRLIGIAGLTLSAPAAYYTVAGTLGATAWGLWTACMVYFAGTVFNVRAWFEVNRLRKAGVASPHLPLWLGASIVLYICLSTLALWVCILWDALPWPVYVVFMPSLIRILWTLWRTPAHLPIKTLGLIEVGQSFLFTLLLLLIVVAGGAGSA